MDPDTQTVQQLPERQLPPLHAVPFVAFWVTQLPPEQTGSLQVPAVHVLQFVPPVPQYWVVSPA